MTVLRPFVKEEQAASVDFSEQCRVHRRRVVRGKDRICCYVCIVALCRWPAPCRSVELRPRFHAL